MQNYKVEVQNHSEGMEAQDLFLEIGFKKSTLLEDGYPKYVVAEKSFFNGEYESCGAGLKFSGFNCQQITLPELRDMVTPKQKEYLVKTDTGYTLQVLSDVVDGHDGIIEVPKDAMSYWECNKYNVKFFSKIEKGSHFYHYLNKNSKWALWDDADFKTFEMKWQRESLNDQVASAEKAKQEQIQCKCSTKELHESELIDAGQKIIDGFTQPEELPFVDDEPKLRNIKIRVNGNLDKAVETIQSMGYWNCQFNRIPSDCYWLVGNSDATVDYGSEQHMYIDHHVEYFVDGAIDKTQETLNERQSTYGDFKDVAGMTQELLAVMEQYGYSDMPKPHKEALHMICSKMARIVNGDHNHLDSWHDIGGYAKLIENNIK